jgi:hypothetical protein
LGIILATLSVLAANLCATKRVFRKDFEQVNFVKDAMHTRFERSVPQQIVGAQRNI